MYSFNQANKERKSLSPETEMMQIVTGYYASQVARAFAFYGIADQLTASCQDAVSLSNALGTDADATLRLLRAGVALGMVTANERGVFSATPLLETLRSDRRASMRGFAVGFTAANSWLPFNNFVEAIRTGECQAQVALGCEFFDYFGRIPDDAQLFMGAMDGVSETIAEEVAALVDATGYESAVDVGGASGILLKAFVHANPQLRGTILELEASVQMYKSDVEHSDLGDRVSIIAGNFFDAVPEADLYLLKWILHDWNDVSCLRILQNCATALRSGGKVVIVELAIGELPQPGLASLLDLAMLTVLHGRERTISEYDALLEQAGMRIESAGQVQSPVGVFNVIQAVAL